MKLTERDFNFLKDLNQYAIFSTRQIQLRHFQNVAMTTVLRRLRILESKGYIRRILGLENAKLAWCLTEKSSELFYPNASKLHFPRFILEHDLKLTEMRLHLEGHGIARSWIPEHETRSKVSAKHGIESLKYRIIPDALMGVQIDNVSQSIAIELELSNKNQRRYKNILWEYQGKSNIWGVWYVVSRPTIARQVLRAARETQYYSKTPYLLWSVLNNVMKDPLNAVVHGYDRKFRLGEMWKPEVKLPAHTAAQGVSREYIENLAQQTKPNTENDEEKLAPAS